MTSFQQYSLVANNNMKIRIYNHKIETSYWECSWEANGTVLATLSRVFIDFFVPLSLKYSAQSAMPLFMDGTAQKRVNMCYGYLKFVVFAMKNSCERVNKRAKIQHNRIFYK